MYEFMLFKALRAYLTIPRTSLRMSTPPPTSSRTASTLVLLAALWSGVSPSCERGGQSNASVAPGCSLLVLEFE
jgi:hypothetical protein